MKEQFLTIKKSDVKKQIVYAEVYAPYTLDTYGDMMFPEDLEKMAHNFLTKENLTQTVDVMHDNNPIDAYPVESFIARKGDPDFTEGSWTVGIKVNDLNIWNKIETGIIGGFSMQLMAKAVPIVVEVISANLTTGRTDETDSHSHLFFAEIDENGVVSKGRTSMDYGHCHEIRQGTKTELTDGHCHRYSM